MGSVYEALLSYRGFIAEHTLFEVKRAGDSFNELDVGYFVTEGELDQYTEDERVRYEKGTLSPLDPLPRNHRFLWILPAKGNAVPFGIPGGHGDARPCPWHGVGLMPLVMSGRAVWR